MVSLTFDEFHALRNRQRAVEEAASKPLPSKSSALSANAVVSRGLAQETDSTDAASQEKVFVEKNDDAVAPSSATPAPSSTTHSVLQGSRSEATGGNDDGGREGCLQDQAHEEAPRPGKRTARVGEFVERFEVQLAVVVLIFLDLVASTAQLLPGIQLAAQDPGGEDRSASFTRTGVRLFLRLMQSFTGFTVIFFGIEVAILLATFRRVFFRHLGYVLDLVVVSICLYFELAGLGKEVRLLGALRAWRVARVMNTLLLAAEEDHNATRAVLRAHEKDFDAERKRLQESMRRELEARRRTERMLRGYKDEVETLNEALRIAAMDISEATASDGTQGQADDTGKKLGQNRDKASPASSRGTKRGSEGTPSGSGRKRGGGDPAAEAQGVKPSPPRSSGQIFVFQDGTFQAR